MGYTQFICFKYFELYTKNPNTKNKVDHSYTTHSVANKESLVPKPPTNRGFTKFMDYVGVKIHNALPVKITEIKHFAK